MNALIAGIGNVFFSDDGFGPAVAHLLANTSLPSGVRVRDFGIRGMHLALEMLEPYDLVVLVDAIARDEKPGTAFIVAPDSPQLDQKTEGAGSASDPHEMDVCSVLQLYERLHAEMAPLQPRPKLLIAGCVPETTQPGMTLTQAVQSAVQPCAARIRDIVLQHLPTGAAT
jgi:hydrogenase maturation protease